MILLNSLFIYGLFSFMLTMGLFVDSTIYKTEIANGNLFWMPFFFVTYSVPNWIGVGVLSTMIGKKIKDNAIPMGELWNTSIFAGLAVSMGLIFGGAYLNPEQILKPTQLDYLKIVGPIIAAGMGQSQLKGYIAQKVNE